MLSGADGAPPAAAAGCHATVLLVPPLPSASGSAAPRARERFLDGPALGLSKNRGHQRKPGRLK